MAARSSLQVQVGAQIRALRIVKRWSMAQLAARIGFTRQGIHRIEHGIVSIPMDTLERIANALGVSPVLLVGGPDRRPRHA